MSLITFNTLQALAAIKKYDGRQHTTLRNLPLSESQIKEAITAICSVPVGDDVKFNLDNM